MCKKSGDGTCFAMKEILLTNPNLGKTTSQRNKSTGNIIQETKFLKEQVQNRTQTINNISRFIWNNKTMFELPTVAKDKIGIFIHKSFHFQPILYYTLF